MSVCILQDQAVELLGRAQISLAEHGEFPQAALDPPGRDLDVLPPQRVLHVLGREAVGGELAPIQPDAHRVTSLAEQLNVGDAGQGLQLIFGEAVGEIAHLQWRMPVGVEGEIHDRLRVGLDLGDDGLIDLVGELAPHARHAIAHIRGRGIRIAGQFEAHGDLAALGAADRGQEIDALDPGEALFQRPGNLAFDDLGAGPGIMSADRHHRLVDGRVLAHRQPLIGDEAEQHDHQAQDRGKDGPAYADLGQAHRSRLFQLSGGGGWSTTGVPSRSLICPAVTTTSPGARPARISTMVSRRSPSLTVVSTALSSTTL